MAAFHHATNEIIAGPTHSAQCRVASRGHALDVQPDGDVPELVALDLMDGGRIPKADREVDSLVMVYIRPRRGYMFTDD